LAPNDFEPETRVIADIDTRMRKFIVAKYDTGLRAAVAVPV
jgi:hypothetical protein